MQEVGTDIFGCSAAELMSREGTTEFEAQMRSVIFRDYTLKLKIFEDNYNDEMKIKCNAIRHEPLSWMAVRSACTFTDAQKWRFCGSLSCVVN